MKTIIFLLLISLGTSFNSTACLNLFYSVDREGHLHEADDLHRGFNTNFNAPLIENKLKKLEKQLKHNPDYKALSDYSVLLLKGGQTSTALTLLKTLAHHYPNDYQIIANLGTAYELSGDNEKALTYIKRGIELNPNSHGGSEWVHVRVLETKLAMAKMPDYLSSHSVLGLSEADKADPDIRKEILIQVRERFPFSPGPNPIMVSILTDLGDCFAQTASVEYAEVLFTIARDYYGGNPDSLSPKVKAMTDLRRQYNHIKPERHSRHSEGEHVKIGKLRYHKLLDDNNPDNYQIKWDQLTTDPATLLGLIDLSIHQVPVTNDTINQPSVNTAKTELKSEDNTNNYTWLILGFCVGLAFALFAIRKRKNK